MTGQFLTHKWRIVVIVLVSVLAVVIILPLLFINVYLTPKLSEKLKNAVIAGSDSLYRIDFSKADLHVLNGDARVYDIVLSPDTVVFHRMQARGVAPAELYELHVKQLTINDAHPFKLYFNKKLEIGQIILQHPEVHVTQYTRNDNKPAPKDTRTLYQKIAEKLHSIQVGVISIEDIHLAYKTFCGPKPETGVLQHMDLKATGLLIDSTTQYDRSRALFCKEINTRLDHFSGTSADGLYQYKFRSIRLSTRTSQLSLTGISMLPLPPKIFFAKSKLDRFTLYMDSVSLNQFNFQKFRLKPDLDITKMTLSKGVFNVYSNPNGLAKRSDRRVTFPNFVVGHMESVFNVDTFNFRRINISYTEYNKDSKQAGTVSFDNTSGRFLHVSNKKDKVARYPRSVVHLTTYVMGKGKLDLAVGFNLNDSSNRYHYTGHLGPIDLQYGNTVLVPLALAKVTSGSVQSLDFDINASERVATGKLTLLYHNLKVELLRHNSRGYSKKTLTTIFANFVVLKNNNPDKPQAAPRFASVAYVRPAHVPFFGNMWQTLLGGIKACVGAGKAEKPQAKPLSKDEQKKQDKALKKAADKKEKEFKKHLAEKKNN